jgi:hypothetical protein
MDEVQSVANFLALFLANTIEANGTGFMLRAKDYDAIGGIPFYPNLLFADFELWINMTRQSYKVTAFQECFAFRLHESTTATSADVKIQQAFGQFILYLEKLSAEDKLLKLVIERYGIDFIKFYCKGLAHRLIRTPKNKRNGLSVISFLEQCKLYADRLVPGNNFNPLDNISVKLASYIDSNLITRRFFLAFKKIYSKPVLS